MTDKPEATKVESTAHRMMTRLDGLAFHLYNSLEEHHRRAAGQVIPMETRMKYMLASYKAAAEILAELDRIAAERKEPA